MKIGALELVVIFIVVLLVIGPDKLPRYARKFGSAMREFRKASADVTQELKESVIDPLEEAQAPLREAMQPIEELDQSLKSDIKGVEDSIKDLGKSKPKAPADNGSAAEKTAAPETGNAETEEEKEAEEAAPAAESKKEESEGEAK